MSGIEDWPVDEVFAEIVDARDQERHGREQAVEVEGDLGAAIMAASEAYGAEDQWPGSSLARIQNIRQRLSRIVNSIEGAAQYRADLEADLTRRVDAAEAVAAAAKNWTSQSPRVAELASASWTLRLALRLHDDVWIDPSTGVVADRPS